MAIEHEIYMAYLANTNAKERLKDRIKHDKARVSLRQQDMIDGGSRLLDWTIKTYWPEIERKAKMGNPRGRPPKKISSQAEQLSIALNFVSEASSSDDEYPYKSHVILANNMAVCNNGLMSAGHPIIEDLNLCPHLGKLSSGLLKCGKTLTIAETPTGQLSIKGDGLRAIVPCIPADTMPVFQADEIVVPIDDKIKSAFKICNSLASEAGERVILASILLEANTCTATNGYTLIQYWHGFDLPPQIILPKLFTAAVAKTDKSIVGFGFSWDQTLCKPNSITIWFEGGAWLKTQCYSDRWQDISHIVDVPNFPIEVPENLFEAIEAVKDFSDDESPNVYFAENKIMSHPVEGIGAQFEVNGIQAGKRFDAAIFKKISQHINAIDFTTYPDKAYFVGGTPEGPIRGCLMAMSGGIQAAPVTPVEPNGWNVLSQDTQDETDGFNQEEPTADDNPNIGWG